MEEKEIKKDLTKHNIPGTLCTQNGDVVLRNG
jgi:hypothetical protein